MDAQNNLPFEQILDEQIIQFQQAISKKCRIDSKALRPSRTDYPIFRPANDEYYEYEYYGKLLEWYIRDYLITGVFCPWIKEAGLDCMLPHEDPNIIRFQYSNIEFGDNFPFALIIKTKTSSVGIRYSSLCLSDEELQNLLREFQIDHIEIIDWTDTDLLVSQKTAWGISHEHRNLVYYVTLHKFINDYFPEGLYDSYIQKVRSAVSQANKEIGFQTIPKLSLRYLSNFKSSVLEELRQFPLRTCQYEIFDRTGNPTGTYNMLLHDEDYDAIEENCFNAGLFYSLVGSENYGKCFLTSEYLYQIFKNGEQNQFDYSALASGYFKSVELLLEKIMRLTLVQPDHEKLYIKSNRQPSAQEKNDNKFRIIGKHWHVQFIMENEPLFATEMGPLIHFLYNNQAGWQIKGGKETIHHCLLNYNQGCRNGHFHKHLIDDIRHITSIRNNTILCLLYLLGACVPVSEKETLDTNDDSFDRLYKALIAIPVKYYYIQFHNQAPIKAVRLFEQEAPQYDKYGNLTSSIRFARIDNFYIEDYDSFFSALSDDDYVIVSRDHMPHKICWYTTQKGVNEINW